MRDALPLPTPFLPLSIFYGGGDDNGDISGDSADKLTRMSLGATLKREEAVGDVVVVVAHGSAGHVSVD